MLTPVLYIKLFRKKLKKIEVRDNTDRRGCCRLEEKQMSFKNGREDPGKYRLVSCFSGPREVMEQIILRPVSKHVEDMKVFASSQHEFMNRGSSLTWQPPIMICLVEEERGLSGV